MKKGTKAAVEHAGKARGKRKPKWLGAVVCMKIMAHKRPVSGEVIGYRVVVAVPNKGRWDAKEEAYVQSFHPTYRIAESSDYSEGVDMGPVLQAWAKVYGKQYRVELFD